MKKSIIIIFIFLGLLLNISFLLNKFFSNSQKGFLEKQISTTLGAKAVINGDLKFHLLPKPSFSVSFLNIKKEKLYDINAGKVEIYISLLQIFKGNFSFSKISLENSKINLELNNELKSLFNNKKPIAKQLQIKESNISLFKDNILIKQFKNLSTLIIPKKDSIQAGLSFNTDFKGFFHNFNFNTDIKLSKNSTSLDLSGNFLNNKISFGITRNKLSEKSIGQIKIIGPDIKEILFYTISPEWFFYPNSQKENFYISNSFSYENSILKINKGNITSAKAINGTYEGEINNKESYINFDINDLNFAKIVSAYNKELLQNIPKPKLNNKIKNNKIKLKGVIKEVILGNDNIISNTDSIGPFDLSLNLNKDSINIEKASFRLNDNNLTNISGLIKDSVFIGNIASSGKNIKDFFSQDSFQNTQENNEYKIDANLEISEKNINIYDLLGNIGATKILGNISYSPRNKQKSYIQIEANDFSLDNFNVKYEDKYINPIKFYYLNLLGKNREKQLLQSFLWLRDIFSKTSFNFSLKNLINNGTTFSKINISGLLENRYLEIADSSFLSDKNQFNLTSKISLKEEIPNANITINAEKISFNSIKSSKWSNDLLKIPNFNNLNFSINSNIKTLTYKNIQLLNNIYNIEIDNNIASIKNFAGEFGKKGKYNIEGEMILEGLPTLNISYSIKKAKLQTISSLILNNQKISANINIAGKLKTFGNTPTVMIKQLDSYNKIAMSNIIIKRLALSNLTTKITKLQKEPNLKFNLENELLEGKTRFRSYEGEIKINKGTAILNNIQLKNNNVNSASSGTINFYNKSVKINSIFSFNIFYKAKTKIKKNLVRITHQLEGNFTEQKGIYNINELKYNINRLKNIYRKLQAQK